MQCTGSVQAVQMQSGDAHLRRPRAYSLHPSGGGSKGAGDEGDFCPCTSLPVTHDGHSARGMQRLAVVQTAAV